MKFMRMYRVTLAVLLAVLLLTPPPASAQTSELPPGVKVAIDSLREAIAQQKTAIERLQNKNAELETNRDLRIDKRVVLEKQVAAQQEEIKLYKDRETLWHERLGVQKQLTANANEGNGASTSFR